MTLEELLISPFFFLKSVPVEGSVIWSLYLLNTSYMLGPGDRHKSEQSKHGSVSSRSLCSSGRSSLVLQKKKKKDTEKNKRITWQYEGIKPGPELTIENGETSLFGVARKRSSEGVSRRQDLRDEELAPQSQGKNISGGGVADAKVVRL